MWSQPWRRIKRLAPDPQVFELSPHECRLLFDSAIGEPDDLEPDCPQYMISVPIFLSNGEREMT